MLPRRIVRGLTPVLIASIYACEVVDSKSVARDTTVAPAVVPEGAPGAVATYSSVLMTPADSLRAGVTGAADDTGTVRIYPPEPRRGGVVFALAEGVAMPMPRCT